MHDSERRSLERAPLAEYQAYGVVRFDIYSCLIISRYTYALLRGVRD